MKEEVKNELEKVKEKFINHYCDRFQISDDIRGMYENELRLIIAISMIIGFLTTIYLRGK